MRQWFSKPEFSLQWAARILAICFILFLAVFALDVFVPGKDTVFYLTAVSIHLIPNFILTAILLIAWKHQQLGGVLFILCGLILAVLLSTEVQFLVSFAVLVFPLLLIGFLFIVDEYHQHSHLAGSEPRL